jgi:tetratricopeptide (TPR) repeat protein
VKYWLLGFVYCSLATPIAVLVSGAMTVAKGQEIAISRGTIVGVLADERHFTAKGSLIGKDYPPVPVKASSLLASTEGKVFLRVAEGAIENQQANQAAEKAFAEAEQLLQQGSADSQRQAIVKYEEALSHWRTSGNLRSEAVALNNIGRVYSSLGEKQKALSYYNQALSRSQAVGDRGSEAATLNNIGRVYDSFHWEKSKKR